MRTFFLDIGLVAGRKPAAGDILDNPQSGGHMEVVRVLGDALMYDPGKPKWQVELRDSDPEVYTLEDGSNGGGDF